MKSTSLSVLNEHDRTLSSEEGARSSPHPQAHPHAHPHSKPAYHRYHPGGRRVRMRHGHSHGHHPREFPPTPPTPRRLAPILSVDSLVSALNDTGVSYLDNGEVFIHPNSSSVPDLKKIFITDFL